MRCVLAAALVVAMVGPAAQVGADTKSDFARAAQLYQAAEAEMRDGNFGDAVRDYSAAYDLTKDPVLFFKIGSANEKAGNCGVAIEYFRRYLAEAKPAAQFVATTQEHLAACGAPATPDGGSAGSAGRAGSAGLVGLVGSGSAGGSDAGVGGAGISGSGSGSGSTTAATHAGHGRDAAWIMVGGAVALATTGVVLAFAASSSESDVQDLYQGLGGVPPQFDAATSRRYQELLDEGHHYEHLSWAAFGLGAVAGAGAVYLFTRSDSGGGEASSQPHARIVPVVTPQNVGVAATLSF